MKKPKSLRKNRSSSHNIKKKILSHPKMSAAPDPPDKKEEISGKISHQEAKKSSFNLFGFMKKKKVKDEKPAEKVTELSSLKKNVKKKLKKRATIQERKFRLRFYLERAGISTSPDALSKRFFNLSIAISLAVSAYLIYAFSMNDASWDTIFLSLTLVWILLFVILNALLWIIFYIFLDLKIFKRKIDIEDVLPDYLQLTASNIKAGMTIDRALWYAVRPRFGVLANEIEIVAKETMRGKDLKDALQKFADKYNSSLVKRSMSLLIEGLDAGGEIGNLLNKIALNIQENKIMKKEMAASVTTYVIFITFATLVAAPILFALAGTLIKVVSTLGTDLASGTPGPGGLSISGSGIKFSDFRIFAMVSLVVSSIFSSIIIATITKGSAKFGLKYIPIFMIITNTIFYLGDKMLGSMINSFI